MLRFIHTSDWQLGFKRAFLSDAQSNFTEARRNAVEKLCQIAIKERCQFIVVAGDAFENEDVDNSIIIQTWESLKDVKIPVYLLPGNHDPVDIYNKPKFKNAIPKNVTVIRDSKPIPLGADVEIIGAPWKYKDTWKNADPVKSLTDDITSQTSFLTKRILIAHGQVDTFSPHNYNISSKNAQQSIEEGKLTYIALGDRHSVTRVGKTQNIYYSGTPEVTRYTETKPGYVLVVDIDDNKQVNVEEVRVGEWQFIEKEFNINSSENLSEFEAYMEGIENKKNTVIKLKFNGIVSIPDNDKLEQILEKYKNLMSSVQSDTDNFEIEPDLKDFETLGFSGFVELSYKKLLEKSKHGDTEESLNAKNALLLLYRLHTTES